MTKNETIKNTRLKTKLRREQQDCKVFELKFDKSHLSGKKLEFLNMLFIEAKWIYNYILSQDSVFKYDYKNKKVIVLNKDREQEEREIKYLSSQIRQKF